MSPSLQELREILEAACNSAVAKLIKQQDPAADLISQNEAYKLYKESRVKRWVQLGLLRSERLGNSRNSKKVYSRAQLEKLHAAEQMKPLIRYGQRKSIFRKTE